MDKDTGGIITESVCSELYWELRISVAAVWGGSELWGDVTLPRSLSCTNVCSFHIHILQVHKL